MADDSWTSPATIVAAWSAVAATAAAVIASRVFAWQRQADDPIITCIFEDGDPNSKWLPVLLKIRNPTGTHWQATEMEIRKPRGALGLSSTATYRIDPVYGAHVFDEDAPPLARFPLDASAEPGSVATERIFLLKSSLRRSTLVMKASLASMDAVQRRRV